VVRICSATVSATAARSVASIARVLASFISCMAVVSCSASTAVVPSGSVGVPGYWSASDTDETSHGAFLASPDRCPMRVPAVTARRIVFADLSTRRVAGLGQSIASYEQAFPEKWERRAASGKHGA